MFRGIDAWVPWLKERAFKVFVQTGASNWISGWSQHHSYIRMDSKTRRWDNVIKENGMFELDIMVS